MPRTVLAGIITATLIAAPAAPAFADQMKTTHQEVVDYSGIDVTTSAGAKIVLRKIERAAERTCGVRAGVKTLEEIRNERTCVSNAIENAIESVGTTKERRAALKAARAG